MLVIPVKDGENIDRALKRFKRKFLQTQVLKEIRSRKQFTKKSDKLRVQKQKAVYSEAKIRNNK
jgi:small subunit ribosomal protein S21